MGLSAPSTGKARGASPSETRFLPTHLINLTSPRFARFAAAAMVVAFILFILRSTTHCSISGPRRVHRRAGLFRTLVTCERLYPFNPEGEGRNNQKEPYQSHECIAHEGPTFHHPGGHL